MAQTDPKNLLAEALGLAESDITETTSLESCGNWDSLAHFRIVAAIEESIGRPLNPAEIFDVTNFESIANLIQQQG